VAAARPIRILLVEDNPGDARLLQEILIEAPSLEADLERVDRLEAAEARLGEFAPDVVLLDLSLPDAHGMTTVTRALQAAPDVPIIVLTGLDDEELALHAVQSGAQDYLVKGQVDPVLLARAIRYAIERKQLDRERESLLEAEQEARTRAEAAVQARDQVLRVVSHDLGNYLSAIRINATVLVRTLEDPSAVAANRQRAEGIGEQVLQMYRLRQDLLDVASIEAGQLSILREPIDVRDLLESASEHAMPLAAEKGIRLLSSADPDLPELDADRDRLLQTLGNLLGNAIKFTPAEGEVALHADLTSEGIRISVSDSGPGIAPENLPKVFESFWKVQSGNPHGAGLGLSIARGIVEAHGGRMWVESEVGAGATFYVLIPARERAGPES
jgi:signal transduction histidine kinase